MKAEKATNQDKINIIDWTRRDINMTMCRAELPETIRGISTLKGDKYIVVLNENMTPAEKVASFLHECLHIYHRDHNNSVWTADEIEARRHRELIEILEILKAREENGD